MKTQTEFVAETSGFHFGYWDDEKQEFIPINEENRKQCAKNMGCSELLLETIEENFTLLVDTVKGDLYDIWEKLEK